MSKIDMTINHNDKCIEIEVSNVYSRINGDLPNIALSKIDDALSYFVPGYFFSKAFKDGWWDSNERVFKRWDGKSHLFKVSSKVFMTGFVSRVQEVLSSCGIQVSIKDTRKPIVRGKEIPTKNIEIREYQQRAVQAAIDSDSGGIIKSATGSGKSLIIAQIAAKMNVKTMIYVIGIDLLYQFKETLDRTFGTAVGVIGDGVVDVKKINVCTVWTAANSLGDKITFDEESFGRKEKFNAKYKDKIEKAVKESELIFFDEAQMLGAETLQAINKASKSARKKLGLSGTPFRDDGCDLLLEGAVGKRIIDIPASELIAGGYLVKPIIHFVEIPESSEELGNTYQSIYKKYIVENEVRNDKIVELAHKLKEAGRKTLILVKNIKHGESLLEKFDSKTVIYFVRGELDSDERNKIRNDFIKGKIDIIIASAVYDQGIDIKNLDALILAGSGKSSGRAIQRVGRIIRPSEEKKNAIVIDFWDNAKYLTNHSQKRLDIYKTEDGFEIKMPKEWSEEEYGTSKEKKRRSKPVSKKNGNGGEMPW